MSEAKKFKKGWPKVGTIRKNDNGSYIKVEPNVEILVDGVKLELNSNRVLRLENPRKKVEQFKESGHITEAEADKRLERLAEMQWLLYDIISPPAK